MHFSYQPLITFMFLSLYILGASAIKCHVCNSHLNESCGTLVDDRYLKNCSDAKDGSLSKGCRKMEQWLDAEILDHKPESRIIRQCDTVSEKSKDEGCFYRSGYGSRMNVCHCYESACNGASTVSVLSLSMFGFLFVCLRCLW